MVKKKLFLYILRNLRTFANEFENVNSACFLNQHDVLMNTKMIKTDTTKVGNKTITIKLQLASILIYEI
jgi:hypothetical protein